MSTACLSLAAMFLPASLYAQTCNEYTERNGLVVMEAENTPSALGMWQKKTSISGFSGSGYLEFNGNTPLNGPARSPLSYRFKVNRDGLYFLHLHAARENRQINGELRTDVANDGYVRLEGNFGAGPNPGNSHGNDGPLAMLKRNTKFFGGAHNQFQWASGNRLDPGGHNNKRVAVYRLNAGENYTFVMSGRSQFFKVNRIMFRHQSVGAGQAQNIQNVAETCATGGGNPAPTPTPAPGNRVSVPGVVQAENYVTFFDTTRGNAGGQHRNDDVDIQATTDTNGGFNVGWIDGNEWLEFPITVRQAGEYRGEVRVASAPGNGMFTLEVDGVAKGNAFSVGSTGGWQNWETMSTSLGQLSAGNHTLRVQVQSGGFNLNWIELKRTGGSLGLDQCNTTQQCRNIFGNGATDCANSQSNASICMCGTTRCDAQ